jgi:hypothetical protein
MHVLLSTIDQQTPTKQQRIGCGKAVRGRGAQPTAVRV